MASPSFDITYLINLYNGYNSIAERLSPDKLSYLHLASSLDEKIHEWLESGFDVILTGNPGDGKTHLMMHLPLPSNVDREPDASQKTVHEIISSWRNARERERRFILAINHAPLRNLAYEMAEEQEFKDLYKMIHSPEPGESAIDNFVIYSPAQEENNEARHTQSRIKLIDLSQREILTDRNISQLLDQLCPIAEAAACDLRLIDVCGRCPLHENAKALQNPHVRHNLSSLLLLVAQRGFHCTMRDLLGFLAYILTGGVTCEQLWHKSSSQKGFSFDYYDYYNLLYYRGRNPLFAALARTYDPGIYADPNIDLQLWSSELSTGWSVSRPEPAKPSNISMLKSLKRRYFFEYIEPIQEKIERTLTNVEKNFRELLNEEDPQMYVGEIVNMINRFYSPVAKDNGFQDRLYLWNQHRYAIGPKSPGYFAMRSYSASNLRIYKPKLNLSLENAFEIRQDHVLLAVDSWLPGDPALRIDWDLYRALWEAKAGYPIEVQPYSILRRLDLFLRNLASKAVLRSPVETIYWGDYRNHKSYSIRVDRRKSTYVEERG